MLLVWELVIQLSLGHLAAVCNTMYNSKRNGRTCSASETLCLDSRWNSVLVVPALKKLNLEFAISQQRNTIQSDSVTQALCSNSLHSLHRQQWPKNFVVRQWRWFKCWGALWKHCQFFHPRPAAWCWDRAPQNLFPCTSRYRMHTHRHPCMKSHICTDAKWPAWRNTSTDRLKCLWGKNCFMFIQKMTMNTQQGHWARPATELCFPTKHLHKMEWHIQDFTWDMTSSDQLSVIVMGWVGLAGILLSFSEGLSSVGPKTVARLCRDILFTLSLSATLGEETMHKTDLHKYLSFINEKLRHKV